MRSQALLGQGSPERDIKQFNSFALDQADKIPSFQLVPVDTHQGLIYPLLFAQSKRGAAYPDTLTVLRQTLLWPHSFTLYIMPLQR